MDNNNWLVDMRAQLLKAPKDSSSGRGPLDDVAIQDIEKWSEHPKAIEILHTLDICAYGGLASGMMMQIMQMMLNECLKIENISYDELLKDASWRK